MRAIHEREVTLLGGECVTPGYRGRRSGSHIDRQTSLGTAIVFGVLLVGFASAATAITVRPTNVDELNFSAGANLDPTMGSKHHAAALW
jgi:hypothetical protein